MIILTDEEMQDPYSALLSGIQSLLDVAENYTLAMSDKEVKLFPKLRWLIQDIDPPARTIRRMGVATATMNLLHPGDNQDTTAQEIAAEYLRITAEQHAIHENLQNSNQSAIDTGER